MTRFALFCSLVLAACGTESEPVTCQEIADTIRDVEFHVYSHENLSNRLAADFQAQCTEPSQEQGLACLDALASFDGLSAELPEECSW